MTREADAIPPRFEQKFLLTQRQAGEVRRMIAPFCILDPFSAKSPTGLYAVTSLYLDTPHLGFYRQWEQAAPHRFKLRVRRYGDKLGESPIFLEVKERIGDVTIKRRTIVSANDWLERARHGIGSSISERAFCVRRDRYRAEPKALVRYQRQAWKGALEAYARVTFDEYIQYQACDQWTLEDDGGGWGSSDDPECTGEDDARVLLEIKFEREVPRWLVGLMRAFELDRRGFSKYGQAIRKMFDPAARLDAQSREPAIPEAF